MKFSDRLDNWAKTIKSLQIASPIPEKTIAVDYPEAWHRVQKLLHIQRWSFIVAVTIGVLFLALRLQEILPIHLNLIEQNEIRKFLMWPVVTILLVSYCASIFRCPRCYKLFLYPGVRTVDAILKNSNSHCKNCGLKMGQKE